MGCQTEVALKSSAFSTLYEEGANLALFGVETHEHDLLATKPTEMKDWPHPGAYIILFRWKVKDDERPVWCLLLSEYDARDRGMYALADISTLIIPFQPVTGPNTTVKAAATSAADGTNISQKPSRTSQRAAKPRRRS